jgi:isopentenyl-diphosphate delta-isomerase
MTFKMLLGKGRAMDQQFDMRKSDHLDLAKEAQSPLSSVDSRFYYEPVFFSHPDSTLKSPLNFLGNSFDFPFWISSMTGGTKNAKDINANLARLCHEFNLGMGLGSCRPLLDSLERIEDFSIRKIIGDRPLYANLGIAQVEQLIQENKTEKIHTMVNRLEASGLIIHINPLQEWFQPEGDRFTQSPLLTLEKFLNNTPYPVIVKEVGQGLGPLSLAALMKLPLKAIEFGAFGGTNFSLLESKRASVNENMKPFIQVGHTAEQMINFINNLPHGNMEFIISGGIKTVLDAHYFQEKLQANSVVGMANNFLAPAMENYDLLREYFINLKDSYLTAKTLLMIKA